MTLIHEGPAATVRQISVSEMENNVYLVTERSSGRRLLIDAADDPEAIAALLAESADDAAGEPSVEAVLTTHQHWDHVRALAAVAPGSETLAGAADAEAIEEQTGVRIGTRLEHADVIALGDLRLEVISLRGHTPGSVAVFLRDGEQLLFTGDSLFPGGPGKTWSAEDFRSLMDDLEARVFDVLPDQVRVLPGHGDPTTLGAERGQLGEWRARGW